MGNATDLVSRSTTRVKECLVKPLTDARKECGERERERAGVSVPAEERSRGRSRPISTVFGNAPRTARESAGDGTRVRISPPFPNPRRNGRGGFAAATCPPDRLRYVSSPRFGDDRERRRLAQVTCHYRTLSTVQSPDSSLDHSQKANGVLHSLLSLDAGCDGSVRVEPLGDEEPKAEN